jgi:enamine deaminase RidA (YjgF/YER057c/UK114 family)
LDSTIKFINPPELVPPPGYSQVVEISGSRPVYIAGQAALDREGNLVGAGDVAAQSEQGFRNLGAALAAVGCTPCQLVKLTVFVRDMKEFALYRGARDRFFASTTPAAAPAITLIEVSKLYRDDGLIEIEALAAA